MFILQLQKAHTVNSLKDNCAPLKQITFYLFDTCTYMSNFSEDLSDSYFVCHGNEVFKDRENHWKWSVMYKTFSQIRFFELFSWRTVFDNFFVPQNVVWFIYSTLQQLLAILIWILYFNSNNDEVLLYHTIPCYLTSTLNNVVLAGRMSKTARYSDTLDDYTTWHVARKKEGIKMMKAFI